jgi:hypothetical protein
LSNWRPYALAALALVAVIAAAAGILRWRASGEVRDLLARIPDAASTIAGIDVAALRSTGALDRIAGPAGVESPEYRAFVAETGFDYRKDLDYAIAGLSDDANYFVLRGRFDWSALQRYAMSNGGSCSQRSCSLRTDSAKDLSFALEKPTLLSISVGNRVSGAKRFSPPSGVAWAVLDRPPEIFACANKVIISVEGGLGGLVVRLAALCPDAEARPGLAANLHSALQRFRAVPAKAPLAELGRGIVETTDEGVVITWRLDSAALTAFVLGERN